MITVFLMGPHLPHKLAVPSVVLGHPSHTTVEENLKVEDQDMSAVEDHMTVDRITWIVEVKINSRCFS